MAYNPEYNQRYYQAHKVEKRMQGIAWEKANPEKVAAIRARKAAKLKADPELKARVTEARRAWDRNNLESVLLRSARNRARRDELDFTIDFLDIKIPETCPLLGIKLVARQGGHGPQDASPSLDRIDNTKGYIKGNVWVVSWLANKMKATATNEQLLVFSSNVQKLLGRE
jgi:hypothetical protein